MLSVIAALLTTLAFANSLYAQTTKPAGTLVIVKAEWGDLPDGGKSDVTEKVKAMVKNGTALSVDATNDNFDDPAANVVKKLRVEYTLDGVTHIKMAVEDATLVISDKPAKIVITKAMYGDLPDGDKTDVTKIVQDQVDGDHMKFPACNALFGDPANGVAKKLTVEYKLNGTTTTKTVDEEQVFSVPQDD